MHLTENEAWHIYQHCDRVIPSLIGVLKYNPLNNYALRDIRRKAGLMLKCKKALIEEYGVHLTCFKQE